MRRDNVDKEGMPTLERGAPRSEDALKSIPSAPMNAPWSSAMKRIAEQDMSVSEGRPRHKSCFDSRVPSGARFSFHALPNRIQHPILPLVQTELTS